MHERELWTQVFFLRRQGVLSCGISAQGLVLPGDAEGFDYLGVGTGEVAGGNVNNGDFTR